MDCPCLPPPALAVKCWTATAGWHQQLKHIAQGPQHLGGPRKGPGQHWRPLTENPFGTQTQSMRTLTCIVLKYLQSPVNDTSSNITNKSFMITHLSCTHSFKSRTVKTHYVNLATWTGQLLKARHIITHYVTMRCSTARPEKGQP